MNQPIDSRQLRAFLALVKAESFTQAAKELHLSQSAVSHSMKALEADLGCRLFDRVGKMVSLTLEGEHLLESAEKILREMAEARQNLQQLGQWGRSRLRLGATTTACQYILPSVLREFKESFPQCQITIEPADSPVLIDLVRAQRIDLALTLEPKPEEALLFHPLFDDELKFVVGPLHPWAKEGRVARDEIGRQNFIVYSRQSFTYSLLAGYFADERIELEHFMELGSMEAIKALVKLGLGVSVLAPWIVQSELQERSLTVLPLGRRRLGRTWGLLCRKSRHLSLVEETFLGLCRAVTEEMKIRMEAQDAAV